jgi:uncharacterized delta-60 repeat protein
MNSYLLRPVLLATLGACVALSLSGCGDDDDGGGAPRAGSSGSAGQGGKAGAGSGGSAGTSGRAGAGGGGSAGTSGQAGAGGNGGVAGNAGAGGSSMGGAGGAGGAAGSSGSAGAGGSAGGGGDDLLDPSFGKGGIVSFQGGFAASSMIRLAPDDRIDLMPGGAVARMLSDGSLDPSFGNNGIAAIPLGADTFQTQAFVTGPDGKVIVAGDELDTNSPGFSRLNADGSPDLSFGDGGHLSITLPNHSAFVAGLAQHGGRLFAVGSSMPFKGFDFKSTTLALLPDGSLDPSFHPPDGYDLYPASDDPDLFTQGLRAVHVTSSGSVYGCGHIYYLDDDKGFDILLLRYRPDGTLDPGFGQGGAVRLDLGFLGGPAERDDECAAVAEAPDGKVVVGGDTMGSEGEVDAFAVVRLLPNGTLDPSFGNQGAFTLDVDDHDVMTDLLVLPDGSIVFAGSEHGFGGGQTGRAMLLRVRPDGTLATEFGQGGIYPVGPSGLVLGDASLARQADGKIVVGAAIPPHLFVARLKPL